MLELEGVPTGAQAWRRRVAEAAAALAATGDLARPPDGVVLEFALPPRRWVDLDTLVESTLAGLRDAGVLRAGYAGLDAVVATKRTDARPGVRVTGAPAARLVAGAAPGPVAVVAETDAVPRPGRGESKRAWRAVLAAAWGGRPPLGGPCWVDVALRRRSSLLAPLEVALDALEPVLGRDPRGRSWQEFFPNDHVVEWLRVAREADGPPLRLALGPVVATAPASGPAP